MEDKDLKVKIDGNKCSECRIGITGSVCFDDETLRKAIDYTISVKKYNDDSKFKGLTKEEILELLKKELNCDTQMELLSIIPVSDDVKYDTFFKIPAPNHNGGTLLSNIDIKRVLMQFEINFDGFRHFNHTMSNWDKNINESNHARRMATEPSFICKLLHENVSMIGFVINTDIWTGAGKHWTAVFIDMRNEDTWTVEFFDSGGDEPNPNVDRLLDLIVTNIHSCNKAFGKVVKKINTCNIQHQLDDIECGVYCLFMIYCRCNGYSHKLFSGEHIVYRDEVMSKFRDYIFTK